MLPPRGRVPSQWKCHVLNKIITTSNEAYFHSRAGWLCECGRWVRQSNAEHTVTRQDIREVFYP